MLPGVEAARRRRVHQKWSGSSPGGPVGGHGCTRRPVFCLFASSFEPNAISPSFMQSSGMNGTWEDDKLGRVAREAKERLDERIRAQREPQAKRSNSDLREELMSRDGIRVVIRELQTEEIGSKKKLVMRWASKLVGGCKA